MSYEEPTNPRSGEIINNQIQLTELATYEKWTPDVFKLFWKEEEMLHHGKHAPVPTILRPVAGIKFEMSSFCA